MHFSAAAISAILATSVIAHPGHDVRQEIAERASFISQLKTRDLSHCSAKLKARGLEQAAVARRSAIAKSERKKRGISSGKFNITVFHYFSNSRRETDSFCEQNNLT